MKGLEEGSRPFGNHQPLGRVDSPKIRLLIEQN